MRWSSWVNGVQMFRLAALLCLGLYAVMLIGGQDRGQLRFGLMQAEANRAAATQVAELAATQATQPAEVAPLVAASFAPEKPLMAAPTLAQDSSETPELATSEGRLFYIASESVNVREGPGKDHAVIDRLPRGEAVLVLVEGEGPDGWSLIRIEGDGIEGYVASRLLSE